MPIRNHNEGDRERALMILDGLPEEDDPEFDELTQWEQEFIADLRDRLAKYGKLNVTGPLLDKLEEIWNK